MSQAPGNMSESLGKKKKKKNKARNKFRESASVRIQKKCLASCHAICENVGPHEHIKLSASCRARAPGRGDRARALSAFLTP